MATPLWELTEREQPADWIVPLPSVDDLKLPLEKILFNTGAIRLALVAGWNDSVLEIIEGLARRAINAEARVKELEGSSRKPFRREVRTKHV